ncbi:MAG: hypothetical protein J6Q82_07990 [Clostridia bacterium]|nr:hypothetical protein [Clostridia bacterium]
MKQALTAIIGNEALRTRFGEDARLGRFPHACILEGAKGTGKQTIAKMTAAALVCERKNDADTPIPCLTCRNCRKILEGKFPDLIVINREDKATLGIDAIRFLKEDVHIVPNDSDAKIYVIEDADLMTPQAQNAFLLTLEEPPSYVHFFLLCEHAELLLETIRSRAPIFRTEPLSSEQIDNYLCEKDSRAAEMKRLSPSEYADLLSASGAGIGQALSYLEPKVWAPIRARRALVRELITAAIDREGAKNILTLLFKLPQKRDPLEDYLLSAADAVRDLMLLKKSDLSPLSFYSNRAEASELSDRASLLFLDQLLRAILQAIEDNHKNANIRLCLLHLATSAELI